MRVFIIYCQESTCTTVLSCQTTLYMLLINNSCSMSIQWWSDFILAEAPHGAKSLSLRVLGRHVHAPISPWQETVPRSQSFSDMFGRYWEDYENKIPIQHSFVQTMLDMTHWPDPQQTLWSFFYKRMSVISDLSLRLQTSILFFSVKLNASIKNNWKMTYRLTFNSLRPIISYKYTII